MSIAHRRDRQGLGVLLKKLKFAPVVSIQGPRQCGKSYLAREILTEKIKNTYFVSLDQKIQRSFAESNPGSFITQGLGETTQCLIIDEAQKAPDLFDEIKDRVDKKRSPGQFLLLGSTEFSIEMKIQESLTGRLSRFRLFPFNVSESLKLELNKQSTIPFYFPSVRVNRVNFLRYLENGGLPGIFSVKSDVERRNLIGDWINLTCERDIHQIKKLKLDSDICKSVLNAIATLDVSNVVHIAKHVGQSVRVIEKHIKALKILFAIIEVRPFRNSTGKSIYYLSDVGVAKYLGSGFEKRLLTWFYLEILSQCAYKNIDLNMCHYYKSNKGQPIHLIYETEKEIILVKVLSHEKYDERDFAIFNNIEMKLGIKKKIIKIALSGAESYFKSRDVKICPWESII